MRTAGIARLLARSGFDVIVHSYTGRKPDLTNRRPSQLHAIESNLSEYVDTNRLRLLISLVCYRLNIPPFWIYLERKFFRHSVLADAMKSADIVIWDFPYVFSERDQAAPKVFVLNTHNFESKLWSGSGFIKRIFRHFVGRIEKVAVKSAPLVSVCSEADRAALSAYNTNAEYLVISNGVDPNRFVNCKLERDAIRTRAAITDHQVVIFSASAYAPNVAGLELLRQLTQRYAAALRTRKIKFLVVGSVSREHSSDEFIHCTGPVDAVEPFFGAADFAINPIFEGSGTSLKLAEYIIAGLPVLTTSVGARGYTLAHGQDAWFFNNANDFLPMLDEMLSAKNHRAISERARQKNASILDINHTAKPLIDWLQSKGS